MIEDEMVVWHQQFNEHEFEQTPRDSEGTRKPGVLQVPEVKVTQSCPTLCEPMDYTVHAILQARILEWVAIPFSRVSSQPRDQTQISCTVGGKSMNTGVGSLSLPQWIFPTQESNWGLLHGRRILYQLRYQGSPVHGVSNYYLVPPASVSSPVTTSLYNGLTGSS